MSTKSREQLRREIAERATALNARQQAWQQQRAEQRQQQRAALASPKMLAGSFATGLMLGLVGGRRRQRDTGESREQPSLLSRATRELLPIMQPLLLAAATQWWQQRQKAAAEAEAEPQDSDGT